MKRFNFIFILSLHFFALPFSFIVAQYPDYVPIDPYPQQIKAKTELMKLSLNPTDWLNRHQAELSATNGKLVVQSLGDDPFFICRDLRHESAKQKKPPITGTIEVAVRMKGRLGAKGQIFWASDECPNICESQSKHFDLHVGKESAIAWHDYHVKLDIKGQLKHLRLDPGSGVGTVEIESVIVRQIEYSDQKIQAPPFIADNFSLEGRRVLSLESEDKTIRVDFGSNDDDRYFGAVIYRNNERVGVIAPLLLCDHSLPIRDIGNTHACDLSLQKSTDGSATHVHAVHPHRVRHDDKIILFEAHIKNEAGQSTTCSLRFWFENNELGYRTENWSGHGPVFRPAGEMRQALLSGVEYLEKGEHSSSSADDETENRIRYAPPPLWMTMPLLSIVTDKVSMSVLYDDPKTNPVFATPNFLDHDHQGHRLNLYGNRQAATIRITAPERLENVILWAVKKRGLCPLPKVPRTGDEQRQLNLAGLKNPNAYRPDQGWAHAIIPGAAKDMFSFHFGADFASTIWQITGKLPPLPNLSYGGAHLENPMAYFLTGHAEQYKQFIDTRAQKLRAEQKDDGSFRYTGKFLRGHWEDTASGFTAYKTMLLLEHARLTGNAESLAAGLKGTEFLRLQDYKTPRGAQTWELSLHTPDIMGSAWCCIVFVRAYELSGRKEYLDLARRWAMTGIPFIYQYRNEKYPVLAYATIPVLGATHWIAPNWIGLPVQWCGLDYAEALFLLAEYDKTGDSEMSLDWRMIAEGILISAEQQQYSEGDSVGLLPDAFAIQSQQRVPADINPVVLERLRRRVEGKEPELSFAISKDGRHRILSPFPVTLDESGNRATISAKEGIRYQILIDGTIVRDVPSQGIDLIHIP